MNTTPYFSPSYFASTYFPEDGPADAVGSGVPTPYFSPSYFPISYFASGYAPAAAESDGSTTDTSKSGGFFETTYFTNSYFPPSYFAGLQIIPNVSAPAYCDAVAFAAIAAALTGTGEFAEVSFVFGSLGNAPLASDRTPLAVISPIRWHDEDHDPVYFVRQVTCQITLAVRVSGDLDAIGLIGQLSNVVQAVLDGSDLGGCLPALTVCRDGQPDLGSAFPEYRSTITLDFSYLKPRPRNS